MDKLNIRGRDTGVKIRVRGGTRTDHMPRLCDTCKHATFMRGPAESDEAIICSEISDDSMPKFRVVECSQYIHKNTPHVYELEQIAWVLRTDKLGRTIGFQPPKKRNHDDED